MSKPVTLLNLIFFNKKGEFILNETISITFGKYEYMQIEIEERRKYWSEKFDMELTVNPDSQDTLTKSEAESVLIYVCKFLNVDFKLASTKMQDGDYIEARRYAINICKYRKMGNSSIGKALNLNHATIFYHIKKHEGFLKSEIGYAERYDKILDYVMSNVGGRFLEDGSGKKVEE